MRHRLAVIVISILACSIDAARAQLVPAGSQFQVNTYTSGSQFEPAAAAAATGDFLVVWRSTLSAADTSGAILGQLYDVAGVAVGAELQVNTYTTGSQLEPAVARMGPATSSSSGAASGALGRIRTTRVSRASATTIAARRSVRSSR